MAPSRMTSIGASTPRPIKMGLSTMSRKETITPHTANMVAVVPLSTEKT